MKLRRWHISTLIWLISISWSPRTFASSESPNLTELQSGWRMISAKNISVDDSLISQPGFDSSQWYTVQRMPATVLQILQENGVYKNLYFGMNLATPKDLWKQDWWYRTTFTAPAGRDVYSLIFKGINYRADIWLNGHKVANRATVVGMYDSFEFNVTQFIIPGGQNVLAVKVTPEHSLEGENGVELADSLVAWINWKYLGYHNPEKHLDISFVPDRNAGIWKRVSLSSTGAVTIRNPYVSTDLPLPATSPALLTVYCDLRNNTSNLSGMLFGEISRPGKPTIKFQQQVQLFRNQSKEVAFTPAEYAGLSVADPDLWWPYQWGEANLYQLKLDFKLNDKNEISDSQSIDFGIHKITQGRDSDNGFPEIGSGGNFFLQVNGKDYLIRGGVYSPDLLFRNDPERDAAIMRYAKDLGLNLLRWELKIADDTMLERADRESMPVMLGWMCCAQWEHWDLWNAEDQWVARDSLRARIRELRSHPAVVLWANGSDGLPPDPVLNDYHQILKEEHWQNAMVDTVSHVNRTWSGIHMAGPYVWRPPYYWFSDKYGPARGSSAEEGDNETIPPVESLKKFIPAEKLWPINEYWYFHAGAKKGLRPINVVWDYYASGDRSTAKLYVANQTSKARNGLIVSLEFFDLEGRRKYFKEVKDFSIGPNTSASAMTVGRVAGLPSTYLLRAMLRNADSNTVLAENVYWGSTADDDLGEAKNDEQFKTSLVRWADMSALNAMPRTDVAVSSSFSQRNGEGVVKITLKNSSSHVAFFLRAEVTEGIDGEEVLPITYDDNYISVFPQESRTITATFRTSELAGRKPALRLEGYNVGKRVLPVGQP